MGAPRDYVILDTETTGLPPGGRLVEIGALRIRGQNLIETFHRLVFPETPVPERATAVHGIRDQDLNQAADAGEVVEEFLAWAKGRPLIAHNAGFDASILAAEAVRFQVPLGENRVMCTLKASRKLLGRRSHSLQSLVHDLGLPEGRMHRALDDAYHAWHLLEKLQNLGSFNPRTLGPGRPLSSFAPEKPRLPASRQLLWEASRKQEAVDLHYLLRDRRFVPIRVTPRLFYRQGKGLWMEALCHQACFYKSYRMDRIVAAHPCPQAGPVEVRRNLGSSSSFSG
ncbi:MAG: 3'-5' exonuclease [Planctomycetota bacterium]|nr:MAG: 3'-5' exonuclease [Planctomycetota bacterium]